MKLDNQIQATRIGQIDNLRHDHTSASLGHTVNLPTSHTPSEGQGSDQKVRRILLKIIVKAKRAGAWRRISPIERGIMTLAVNLKIRFRSISLLRAITNIVRQIAEQTSFLLQNYLRGMKTAHRMAQYAAKLGHQQARSWVEDRHFIIWWGIFLNPNTYTK